MITPLGMTDLVIYSFISIALMDRNSPKYNPCTCREVEWSVQSLVIEFMIIVFHVFFLLCCITLTTFW